jgi:hypothetical protein
MGVRLKSAISQLKILLLCLMVLTVTGFLNSNQNQVFYTAGAVPETEITLLWNVTYELPYSEGAGSIVKCNTGYAIAGSTNSSGKGDTDVLFMRLAPDGTYLWNRTFGDVEEDNGYQVIRCQSGGFAIASTYYNVSAATSNSDFLVTRLADNGAVIWNRSYSGPDQDHVSSWVSDLGRSIVECDNGDLVVAGVTMDVDCDVWMFRLNQADGSVIWERTYHNRDIDRCFAPDSVVQCQDGGFAIVGYTYSAATTNDVWLIKTNAAGIEIWNSTYGDDIGYQRPAALVECSDGGFGIAANTQSFGAGGTDAWVVKVDAFGNQLWNKTFGGTEEDSCGYIMEMADGGFTISGSTHSFDMGQGDGWLIRTDIDGNTIWNHTVGDEYGNGAGGFVYEGNNTYVVVGSTHRVGEPFADIWTFKAYISFPSTTTPTTPTSPTDTGSLPSAVVLFTATLIVTILLRFYKRKVYYHKKLR